MPLAALPPVIGHRGARALAPENTLAGLRCAAALRVGSVEVDVRLSADGVPVLLHDDTLERTTDGHGALADTPLAALRELDAGSWFGAPFAGERLPTLEEFLLDAQALGIHVNLELKGRPGDPVRLAETTLAVARSVWRTGAPPLVSSFDWACLETAARCAADWPRGLLLDFVEPDWPGQAAAIGAAAIIVNHACLDGPEAVAELGADGRPVLAYTVNDPARARRLRGWGVAAVITDRPDRKMADAAGQKISFGKVPPGVVP